MIATAITHFICEEHTAQWTMFIENCWKASKRSWLISADSIADRVKLLKWLKWFKWLSSSNYRQIAELFNLIKRSQLKLECSQFEVNTIESQPKCRQPKSTGMIQLDSTWILFPSSFSNARGMLLFVASCDSQTILTCWANFLRVSTSVRLGVISNSIG